MAEAAFQQCQNTITPQSTQDMISQHSAAMASLMQAMGIGQCTTTDAKTDAWIITTQVDVSVGCEQVAIMSQYLNTCQQVLQCSVSSTSQTSTTQIMFANNITIELTGHATITCFQVQQDIQGKVASTSDFGTQVINQMGSYINDTVNSMAKNVQDASKDLTTTQAQRSVQQFTQQLQQTANQSGFSEIVQNAINNFQASNNFTLKMSDYALVGLATPNAVCPSLVVTQRILMQVLAQNMMDASLKDVFNTSVAQQFTSDWVSGQSTNSHTTPSLLSQAGTIVSSIVLVVIIIAVVAVAVLMLLKGGGNNTLMSGTTGNPGDKGKGLSIFFIALGGIVFILGIACLATNFSTVVGAIAIVVGAICIAIAGYMLYRSMQIAKQAKQGTLPPPVPIIAPKAQTEATK